MPKEKSVTFGKKSEKSNPLDGRIWSVACSIRGAMYALQPNLSRISREFLKFLLLAPAFSDYAVEKSDRNAMPKINQTALRAFRFRIPDPSEQTRIAGLLSALLAKQTELRRLQTRTEAELAAFTPAPLAKAFKGEL